MAELPGYSLRELALHLVVDDWLRAEPAATGRERDLRLLAGGCRPITRRKLVHLVGSKTGRGLPRLLAADVRLDVAAAVLVPRIAALIDYATFQLQERRGWSSSRAYLANLALRDLLAWHLATEIGLGDDLFTRDVDLTNFVPHRRPRPRAHALLPDLDAFFGQWNTRILQPGALYRLGALLCALPFWLEVARERGLLGVEEITPYATTLADKTVRHAPSLWAPLFDPAFEETLRRLVAESASPWGTARSLRGSWGARYAHA